MVEYVLRLWSCTRDPKCSSLIRGRLRFSLTPLAVVDLVAIPQTLIGLLISAILGLQVLDSSFLRTVRLTARVAKLSRYSSGAWMLGWVIQEMQKSYHGSICTAGAPADSIFANVLCRARGAPDKFPSMPSEMWWIIITLTTVGYGDVFTVTGVGQGIAGGIAILVIGLFALPAGILGSGFLKERDNAGIPGHGSARTAAKKSLNDSMLLKGNIFCRV